MSAQELLRHVIALGLRSLAPHASLRHRLLAGFACMAGLAALSGMIGLHYVDRISNIVAQSAEATAPLAERIDLVDKATGDAADRLGAQDEETRGPIRAIAALASETANDLGEARQVVAEVVLFAIFVAAALGLVFAHRLTSPLLRLTDQVREIARSGELTPVSLGKADRRGDEFATLIAVFNHMIGELADVRRRQIAWSEAEARIQFERLNLTINSIPQGFCMFDATQSLVICNRRYAQIYDLPPERVAIGTSLRAILDYRTARNSVSPLCHKSASDAAAAIAEGKPWHYVDELPSGKVVSISYLPLSNGGSVSTHEDITESRQAAARIEHLAHFDALTDLANRVLFLDTLETVLKESPGSDVAVLCVDLDQFKIVNDTLGHAVGDELLQAVAGRLRDCLTADDSAARLGGDEFAILQRGLAQPMGATALAGRLIHAISQPYWLQGHHVVVGASVGISFAPKDGSEPGSLLRNADMALYRVKADGRGNYRFFDPGMDAHAQARRALEIDLRNALAREEFELHYQPLINLVSDRICACEALIRWHHPQRGTVAPVEFIALAEDIGLINQIGAWTLKTACTEAMRWPGDVSVAVNLSPVQFKSGALVLDVISALGASGLAPCRLELEITETLLLNDAESTILTLNQLRALGVRISMDDFGTGYSSLGYLRKFPFDKIKIDRSFVKDLPQSTDSVAIVRAVTGLGMALGISTTAEGVETEGQLQQLKQERCTEAQGYFLGRPQRASEISRLFAAGGERRAVGA